MLHEVDFQLTRYMYIWPTFCLKMAASMDKPNWSCRGTRHLRSSRTSQRYRVFHWSCPICYYDYYENQLEHLVIQSIGEQTVNHYICTLKRLEIDSNKNSISIVYYTKVGYWQASRRTSSPARTRPSPSSSSSPPPRLGSGAKMSRCPAGRHNSFCRKPPLQSFMSVWRDVLIKGLRSCDLFLFAIEIYLVLLSAVSLRF